MRWSRWVSSSMVVCVAASAAAQERVDEALLQWFVSDGAATADVAALREPLTRDAAAALLPEVVAACRAAQRQRGRDTLPAPVSEVAKATPGELRVGDYVMPFVLLAKGEKPAGGWPLYLCLHGGGGNSEAKGPHAWSVNTREWQAQQRLFERVYEAPGLYFIPRMADDRQGRWWFAHNQRAFDEVIRKAILFLGVDPDRVYMMGISEGGYGAIRFAGNRPDRFAATGGMAAAEPLGTSPPENMRNVAMRIDIGEQDTMFDRVGLARRMGERLAQLHEQDAAGYDFVVNVQAGRGHGIDYSLTPAWLADKVREPRPSRVVWTVKPFDREVELRCYWLALPEVPAALPLRLVAEVGGNKLAIAAQVVTKGDDGGEVVAPASGKLLVRLDDALVDLDAPIEVSVNGSSRGAVKVVRTARTMLRTMAERWDPRGCFCAELEVDLAPR
ncbi:MAG: hypothetical protein H6838_12540 [Planctomycetes bacterium]|nr:hypothetical protein [Planctomycetota bacterium]